MNYILMYSNDLKIIKDSFLFKFKNIGNDVYKVYNSFLNKFINELSFHISNENIKSYETLCQYLEFNKNSLKIYSLTDNKIQFKIVEDFDIENKLIFIDFKIVKDYILKSKHKAKYNKDSIFTEKTLSGILRRFFQYTFEHYNLEEFSTFENELKNYKRYNLVSNRIKFINLNDFEIIKERLIKKSQEIPIIFEKEKERKSPKNFVLARNLFVLKAFCLRGLKSEEMKDCRINDIGLKKISYQLRLLQRRGRNRDEYKYINIFKQLIEKEVNYLKAYFDAFGKTDNHILVSSRNLDEVMDNNNIAYIFKEFFTKEIVQEIKLPDDYKLSSYLLRHSYGIYLASKYRSVQTIKRHLRLVKSKDAQMYLKTFIDIPKN